MAHCTQHELYYENINTAELGGYSDLRYVHAY